MNASALLRASISGDIGLVRKLLQEVAGLDV